MKMEENETILIEQLKQQILTNNLSMKALIQVMFIFYLNILNLFKTSTIANDIGLFVFRFECSFYEEISLYFKT